MEKSEHTQLVKVLEELLIKSLLSFSEVEFEEKETDLLRFNIKSDEPGMIIGKHGDTLFALQQIFRTIASRKFGFEGNVILDADNYRLDQEKSACEMAQDIARKVRGAQEAVELIPMPSYKRRAIHMMFMEDEYKDLEVYSVGEGETRRIRVAVKK